MKRGFSSAWSVKSRKVGALHYFVVFVVIVFCPILVSSLQSWPIILHSIQLELASQLPALNNGNWDDWPTIILRVSPAANCSTKSGSKSWLSKKGHLSDISVLCCCHTCTRFGSPDRWWRRRRGMWTRGWLSTRLVAEMPKEMSILEKYKEARLHLIRWKRAFSCAH